MRRLLILMLVAFPALAWSQAKLTVDKTKLNPGEKFEVRYTFSGTMPASSWIGVIPSDTPHGTESVNDAHDVAYQYTNETQGTFTFEAPVKSGSYDLRWSGGGKEFASTTIQVAAIDWKASLKLEKNVFNPGDDVALNFSVAAPLPKTAWIGVIPSNVPHGSEDVNDQNDVDYQYVGEKQSGTLQFHAPSKAGSYDFRLNDVDGGGTELASVTFQVGAVKLEGTLKLKRTSYAPGEQIEVEFTAPAALPRTAWVGMIPSDIPHGKEEVNDQHDIQFFYLDKKPNGSFNFVAPPQAGSYDLRMNSSDDNGQEITSVSFKVGGALSSETMAKSIQETGKITLYGIQFDFNQATIKPESEATLKEVGALLTQQPDLKLRIQGHTDNVGKAAYNLDLSRKRAESVKNYLVQNFQIETSRLTTEGFGDTKPIAKNDTEQGRAQNRRVELAKL